VPPAVAVAVVAVAVAVVVAVEQPPRERAWAVAAVEPQLPARVRAEAVGGRPREQRRD